MTAGGAYLRHAAAKAIAESRSQKALAKQARDAACQIAKTPKGVGFEVHHRHTVIGHASVKDVRRNVKSFFPTIGLGPAIYNHPWNLTIVTAEKDTGPHPKAYRGQSLVYYTSHPLAVAARAIVNFTDCWKKPWDKNPRKKGGKDSGEYSK